MIEKIILSMMLITMVSAVGDCTTVATLESNPANILWDEQVFLLPAGQSCLVSSAEDLKVEYLSKDL